MDVGGVGLRRGIQRFGAPYKAVVRDIRYAMRVLARNPGYTVVALASLGLGIGLHTATFSVTNALLLEPPGGVSEPDRLVAIHHQDEASPFSSNSYPHYEHYREQVGSFSDMTAYVSWPMYVGEGGSSEQVTGGLVSPNYFTVLGVAAAVGRTLLPSDGHGADTYLVTVLSHGFWQRRFGGDPDVVGADLTIGGHPFTIIGVAAREYRGLGFDDGPDLWVPAQFYRLVVPQLSPTLALLENWGNLSFHIVARLAPGVSLAEARAELAVSGERALALRRTHADMPREWKPVALPLMEARIPLYRRDTVHRFLVLLGATSAAILLITSLNVANLTAARSVRRSRELAVRLSLGAGRSSMVRQLVTESLLLSFAGGAAGLLVARAATGYLSRLHEPLGLPLSMEGALGVRVLFFAFLLCLLAGLVAALAPALQSLRLDPMHALKADATGARGGRRFTARDALIVAQVALSLVLLVPAGLLLRTLQNARAEDVTVAPEQVLVARLNLIASGYEPERARQLYAGLVERASAMPGVEGAALVGILPMGGWRGAINIMVGSADDPSGRREVNVEFNTVTPSYFHVVGLPMVAGQSFAETDGPGAPPTAVINERMANLFWPGEAAVGKTFELAGSASGPVTVTGVVRDGKFRNYRAPLHAGLYLPYAQRSAGDMTLQVRTMGKPLALADALRRELEALDPSVPRPTMQTMAQHRDAMLSPERLAASLLSAGGLLALGLALLGIYGIISFMVEQRTREIGIRMALGAGQGAVIRLMLKRTLALTAIGLILGVLAAAASSRMASSLLYGIEPLDLSLYGAVGLGVVTVAALTTYIPARRAARIEPTCALRWE